MGINSKRNARFSLFQSPTITEAGCLLLTDKTNLFKTDCRIGKRYQRPIHGLSVGYNCCYYTRVGSYASVLAGRIKLV